MPYRLVRVIGLLVCTVLLGGLFVAAGDEAAPVLVEQPTVADVREYEASFDSRPAPVPDPSSEAAIGPDALRRQCPPSRSTRLATRVHFHRPPTTMPPGRIRYFADPDSVVQCVSYTWDESHTMTGTEMVRRLSQGGVDPDTVIGRYDFAFDEVVRSLQRRVGDPVTLDPRPQADTSGPRKQYRRHAHWETPEVVIDLTLNVSLLGGQIQVDQYWRSNDSSESSPPKGR